VVGVDIFALSMILTFYFGIVPTVCYFVQYIIWYFSVFLNIIMTCQLLVKLQIDKTVISICYLCWDPSHYYELGVLSDLVDPNDVGFRFIMYVSQYNSS